MLLNRPLGQSRWYFALAVALLAVTFPGACLGAEVAEEQERAKPEAAAEAEAEAEAKTKKGQEPAAKEAKSEESGSEKSKSEASDDGEDADEAKEEKPKATRTSSWRTSRKPKEKKIRYADFVFSGSLPESPGGSGPFGELSIDLRKQIARLDQAAEDDSIQGLVIRFREPMFGRGQVNELREAIGRFRATGKKVVAELELVTGPAYQVACACDEIVMPESGFMLIPGVRAEPLFYKGLLAKIGVKADFVHVGEAKGAAEPYMRRSWSEPVKENMTALVDDLYEQMIETITMDRPMKRETVVKAIDRGLMTAAQAHEYGLIDRIAYSGSLRSALQEDHGGDRVVFVENYGKEKVDTDFSGPTGFFKLLGMMAGGGNQRSRSGQKIAIVYAVGPIMTGKSEVDPFGSSDSVGSTTIVDALDKAASDSRTAAIVLRVNSPGGSALASDLIWRKIQEIDKPVVASMGDVAASGGYYISMGCDKIYAEPNTVTGSIGVVGGKLAVKGMFSKLGITTDLVSRGQNSGMFSLLDQFSDTEREALVALMDDTYDQFTAKAAEGRGLPQERIKELGGGKVYTGRQAKQLGLVDELGDLRSAIMEAKRLADIDVDTKVRLEMYPEAVDFFESLFGDNEAEREVRIDLTLGGAVPELEDAVRSLAMLRKLFAHEPVAVLMPFELEIE